MTERSHGLVVIGFGAGAIDRHLQVGNVAPDHVPGLKNDFTPADHVRFGKLKQAEYEEHPGGNVMNALSYLATREGNLYAEVGMTTVLGRDKVASRALRRHMVRMGITPHIVIAEGYEPSVSMIERAQDKDGNAMDRMVRGRPRGPMADYMAAEHIQEASKNADAIVIASLKSQQLNRRVLENIPSGAKTFINLGSSETNSPKKAQEALYTLTDHQTTMIALNSDELRELFGAPDADPRRLAAFATEIGLSKHMLVTLGSEGLLLAHNGDTIQIDDRQARLELADVAKIDPSEIVSTLGAGDRANGIAIDLLLRGTAPEDIPALVAQGTLDVLRVAGAHADLYANMPPYWRIRARQIGRQVCTSFRPRQGQNQAA